MTPSAFDRPDFATRLQTEIRRTGLTAEQLGVARIYDRPRTLATEPNYPHPDGAEEGPD
ncbi:hypothetical protein [Corynebacterium auriscanis]